MGTQETKRHFVKNFFHLCINGGTQEGKRNFAKKNLHSIISGSTRKNIMNIHSFERPFQRIGGY